MGGVEADDADAHVGGVALGCESHDAESECGQREMGSGHRK